MRHAIKITLKGGSHDGATITIGSDMLNSDLRLSSITNVGQFERYQHDKTLSRTGRIIFTIKGQQ